MSGIESATSSINNESSAAISLSTSNFSGCFSIGLLLKPLFFIEKDLGATLLTCVLA